MPEERKFKVGPTIFNKNLFMAMTKEGIDTPARLAKRLQVSPQLAHKWLSEPVPNIAASDVFKISDRLKVSARWLMGDSSDMTPGRKLDPGRIRALDLYDELEKIDKEMATTWLTDWISNGWHTVEQMKRIPSVGVPFPRR